MPDLRGEARTDLAAAGRLRLVRGRQSLAIARHQGEQPPIVYAATFARFTPELFLLPDLCRRADHCRSAVRPPTHAGAQVQRMRPATVSARLTAAVAAAMS